MTDSNGEWVTFPDAGDYQASHRGKIRSFKRDPAGYVLRPHVDPDDYRRFNYTDDNGVRHTNVHVARAVLLAHDPRPDAAQLHVCHGPGGPGDNRWPENIRWDTPDVNRQEALAVRLENTPLKPPKVCPRCGAEHRERGKNCQECFEGIGVQFARLLADGVPPERAAELVEYPLNGALNLALRYGGLRFIVDPKCIPATATGTRSPGRAPHPAISPVVIDDEVNATLRAIRHAKSPRRWLLRVINRREASRGNSDGA